MKKLIKQLLLIPLLLGAVSLHAASTTTTVDLMVTPIVTVSLSLSATNYDFGNVSLGASTNSATALVLSNTGNVNVSVTKTGANSTNWTLSSSTSTSFNTFALWVATGTTRPALTDYRTDIATPSDLVTSGVTNLTGILSGSNVSIVPGNSVNLWFKLGMPTTSSTAGQQKTTIQFTGTAQ